MSARWGSQMEIHALDTYPEWISHVILGIVGYIFIPSIDAAGVYQYLYSPPETSVRDINVQLGPEICPRPDVYLYSLNWDVHGNWWMSTSHIPP